MVRNPEESSRNPRGMIKTSASVMRRLTTTERKEREREREKQRKRKKMSPPLYRSVCPLVSLILKSAFTFI